MFRKGATARSRTRRPTVASVLSGKNVEEHCLGCVVPGQRDGAKQWYLEVLMAVMDYTRSELKVGEKRNLQMRFLSPCLKKRFNLSLGILEPGGEISFLKKRHILTHDVQLLLALQPAHIGKLREL